ncbi:hypothetical protein ACSTS3_21275 [Aquimarina muelleri]|uniref:hypothetical protein n=1 Tax=Aquimarina muelleri TaxID=279356 RepID=UPI003F6881F6
MKNIIDSYKVISPIILLYIYLIGYSILTSYYSVFSIEIIYYITLSDIIFITLKYTLFGVIFFTSLIVLLESLAFIVAIFYKTKEKQLKIIKIIPTAILFSLMIVSYFLGDYYGYKFNHSVIILLTILFIYISLGHPIIDSITSDFSNNKLPNQTVILGSLFMIWIGSIAIGHFEAKTIQQKESFIFSKYIEFKYEKTFYSTKTNKNLNFIGETKDVLFIYDKSKKETLVFYKSNLIELKLSKNYLIEKVQ